MGFAVPEGLFMYTQANLSLTEVILKFPLINSLEQFHYCLREQCHANELILFNEMDSKA